MAIGVDVLQSNGVRVWRDAHAELRVVPAFEAPSSGPEEQRDVVRLVVCDREVGKPVLVEIRDGQARRILIDCTGSRHTEAALTPAGSTRERVLRASFRIENSSADYHSPLRRPYGLDCSATNP